MPTMRVSGGLTINYVRSGPIGTPTIIFLHPVGLDLTWWDQQFAALGADYDLIAADMPNHGLSGILDAAPTFDRLAAITAELLEQLTIDSVHVVGLSVGGMIAQMLALARPDLVRSLSLVGTLCTFPDLAREILRERARVARTEGMARIAQLSQERWFPAVFRERRSDILDRAAKCLLRQDAEFHASMWEMIAGLDLEAQLPNLTVPTLVVAGEEDINAPVAAGQKIASLIPGAEFHALAGVGHFPTIEATEAFNQILRAFLARSSAFRG